MADLTMVSGVAERTLAKHFRNVLGLSPLNYARQLRLTAAREGFLHGAHGGSVTEVATHFGFTHLGRFSAQYRRAFGEPPSTTLRRARTRISGSCESDHDDRLGAQDRTIDGVVSAGLPNFRGAEIECAQRFPPENPDAYALTMRALPLVFASGPGSARRALDLLHRAIGLDPDDGLAIGLAGWCHAQLVMYNGSRAPCEDRASAVQLAQRAGILDRNDPLVLTARCAVHTMVGDLNVASCLVARALALDPSLGWAWGRSGWLNSYSGNSEIAIDHFRRAISLDPSSSTKANSFVGIGSAHFHAGRYEAAAFWLRKAMAEQPETLWAHRTLSVSYARLGERTEALKSLNVLRRYCPDLTVNQVVTAIPFRSDYLRRLGEGLSDLGLPT
jgi:adenylate cyclase